MWSRLTNVLRASTATKDESTLQIHGLSREEPSNLLQFQLPDETNGSTIPDTSNSPSIHNKKSMLKRLSKPSLKDDGDTPRPPSPFHLPATSKKPRGPDVREVPLSKLPSFDPLRVGHDPRQALDATPTGRDRPHRTSADMFAQDTPPRFQDTMHLHELNPPGNHLGFNSVRSILRDPKTPGTGQSVRFFSQESFKVITPDHSNSDTMSTLQPAMPSEQLTFMDRLSQSTAGVDTPPKVLSKTRPSISEIFTPLHESSPLRDPGSISDLAPSSDMSLSDAIVATQLLDLSNVSQFHPPGLGIDLDDPLDSPLRLVGPRKPLHQNDHQILTTSTPARDPKVKGSDTGLPLFPETDSISPGQADESVFHSMEKSPKFPSALHDRSQSLTPGGQTTFFSVDKDDSPAYPSSEHVRPSSNLDQDSPMVKPLGSTLLSKARTRAMGDTVFQNMLRVGAKDKSAPEADINDISNPDFVVDPTSEPDPFSAHATTYYTPQTMIPVTPPRGAIVRHPHGTSKEESLIISLQTQLSLRTELCSQYEADLKARDELVEILGKKLGEMEKEDAKRKGVLRNWKKRVQELERVVRLLEEEVDDSRQESMGRSMLDEASGDALRMLHRQIETLEKEKSEWNHREQELLDRVEELENLAQERSDVIYRMNESTREVQDALTRTAHEMDSMSQDSIANVDETILKRLEREQKGDTIEPRASQYKLQQEMEELQSKFESLQLEKDACQDKLEEVQERMKEQEREYNVLKSELEAQWGHTEVAGEKMNILQKEKKEAEELCNVLQDEIEEYEVQVKNMEAEWQEAENRKNELEVELQEVWNVKETLEKDQEELAVALEQERDRVRELELEVDNRDSRVAALESECKFAQESVARLEENLRRTEGELVQVRQRAVSLEDQVDHLREELIRADEEHTNFIDKQTQQLREVVGQEGQTKARVEELVRAKAVADVELKSARERLAGLNENVEKLRRQVHVLQTESADKEVKIVQLTKQRAHDRDDIQGLNIALDSKQQELELIKRKLGVRGTAGSTPAATMAKATQRRESSIFSATPLPSVSRPASALSDLSDTGVKKRSSVDTPSTVKPSALGRTGRIGNTTAVKVSSRTGGDGTTAVSSLKSRLSIGTPTPMTRGSALNRTTSGGNAASGALHRRASVSPKIGGMIPSSFSEAEEKENMAESVYEQRRSRVASLA